MAQIDVETVAGKKPNLSAAGNLVVAGEAGAAFGGQIYGKTTVVGDTAYGASPSGGYGGALPVAMLQVNAYQDGGIGCTPAGFNGTGYWMAVAMGVWAAGGVDKLRVPTYFGVLQGQGITSGTAVPIYSPPAGTKFRLMGAHFALSVAGAIILKDSTTVMYYFPNVAAGVPVTIPPSNGILSALANNTLYIDASASGTVTGTIMLATN